MHGIFDYLRTKFPHVFAFKERNVSYEKHLHLAFCMSRQKEYEKSVFRSGKRPRRREKRAKEKERERTTEYSPRNSNVTKPSQMTGRPAAREMQEGWGRRGIREDLSFSPSSSCVEAVRAVTEKPTAPVAFVSKMFISASPELIRCKSFASYSPDSYSRWITWDSIGSK